MSASLSRLFTALMTGRRPTNSGMSPNFRRSSGSTARRISPTSFSSERRTSAPNPMPWLPVRFSMIFSTPGERATADEQDVGGVDLDELLVRVLAPTLWRHRRGGALQDLQQRLLHAFAGDVTGDRRVLGLAGDLVDLVDVDDAGLGLLDVVVGGLDQLEEDVLDVFADVARLGERGGVGDRERHLEQPGERLREQRLAAAGGADQQDVRLLQLDVGIAVGPGLHPLVVVVDRDRQDLLRLVLTDHVVVQVVVDLTRLRAARRTSPRSSARAPLR